MKSRRAIPLCQESVRAPVVKKAMRYSRRGAQSHGSAPPSLKTLLLVLEKGNLRLALKWFLTHSGYVVDCVNNAQEAIAVFHPVIHDLVVTGNTMPGMSGAEMARLIKTRSPATPIVMMADKLPADSSCVDLVIKGTAHMLVLKVGIDRILATE
jgi:DNA-binding NtrC family response regulator